MMIPEFAVTCMYQFRLGQSEVRSRVNKTVSKTGLRDSTKKKNECHKVSTNNAFRKSFNPAMRRVKVNV